VTGSWTSERLRGVVAQEIWETGQTSDRNRAILDVLDEHAQLAALLEQFAVEDWRGNEPIYVSRSRALLARLRRSQAA